MYAYQWWADTTTGLLKIRNAANSAWVTIGTLASANLGLLPLAGGTMTGVLAVTAGTAALPGIAVSGDTNTGIYSPGADQLAISTGGTVRATVDSSGNIVIGTSSTSGARLFVAGGALTSSAAGGVAISATLSAGRLTSDSSNINSINTYLDNSTIEIAPGSTFKNGISINGNGTSADTNTIKFFTANTERARIDSSGRLLVGTSSGNANGGILQLSSGITFPATAVAASDANTLDDYEEGTWTPTQGAGLTVVGAYTSQGFYTKVGNKVVVFASLFGATSISSSTTGILCGGLPFTPAPPSSGFIAGSLSNQAGNISNTCLCVNSTNVYGAVAIAATTGIHITLTYRV